MNDIINIDGKEIKADQVYPGFCCAGFDWTVAVVFPHAESVWGCCKNPDCPRYHPDFGENDPYRGVTVWEPREFLEMVESGEPVHPAQGSVWETRLDSERMVNDETQITDK